MISIRQARAEYWRRFRMIDRRHRPLPVGCGRGLESEDALVGLELDEVLEGPDVVPIIDPPNRASILVKLPPLTFEERGDTRRKFHEESGFLNGDDPELDRELKRYGLIQRLSRRR